MITITLPFDTRVRVATSIGAYLERALTQLDRPDWQVMPGEFTDVSGCDDPSMQSGLLRNIRQYLEEQA